MVTDDLPSLATTLERPPGKRRKNLKAPDTVSVSKTAVFKIHNPSRHKRAMLTDSMQRAHLAYTRLLASV
jgi:hypothetical protein